MVFPKTVTIFAYNFKRKCIRYLILSLQVASIPSATSCCYLSEYFYNRDANGYWQWSRFRAIYIWEIYVSCEQKDFPDNS